MKICHVNEMRELDKQASEKFGIREELLMENAGLAAFSVLQNNFPIKESKIAVFCGVGNNGGDGFVVARKIHSAGGKVTVFIIGDPLKFRGAAKLNFDIIVKLPVDIVYMKDLPEVKKFLKNTAVIIDAIFGTGLDREVSGPYREVIDIINKSKKTVISLDIPSGINGDTAQIMGTAIYAKHTITFGLPKLGNMLYPGYAHCDNLYVTHISFPQLLYNSDNLKIATNDLISFPKRNRDSHKGSVGKVLFIAGSSNYLGAPYLAAMSFLKAGGGLSYLASPDKITSFIAKKGKELVMLPQKSTDSGSISSENLDNLIAQSKEVDMVVMGPGLSLNEETQKLVLELAAKINKPLLIDGDGITAVVRDLKSITQRNKPTILTPHIGEMSRITNTSKEEIINNRIDILQKTCSTLNSIIVLKGGHSLIGYPDKNVYINLSGNPGMATAGSGDVLTGAIAAMFGLGLSLHDSVRMGVFIHGFAGDLVANKSGEDGMIAGDIMKRLPAAMKKIRDEFDIISRAHYNIFTVL